MHTSAEPWPTVTTRMKELFRQGAELALSVDDDSWTALHQATFAGLHSPPAAMDDPMLLESVKHVTTENLRQWIASNVSHPGRPVTPVLSHEAIALARDMVRRGLDSRALDSYRTGQSVAWRLWMDICFTLTNDVRELQELLDISALSISTFLDETVEALSARIEADMHDLAHGTHAERMATLTLVVEGAPISRTQVENRLGYQLAGDHTAAVIWSGATAERPGDATSHRHVAHTLEQVADELMLASQCTRRLTLVASTRTLWVWLPTADLEVSPDLASLLAESDPEIQIAIGRPGNDLEGFRRSHLDATQVQRMITHITSPQPVTRYADVQLVSLMTADLAKSDEFVSETLGPLEHAEAELRETLSTYIREQFNASRTAARLFTHRNTILRRLDRADQLLPRPLADNLTNIAAALEISRLRPQRAARSTADRGAP